MIAMFVIGYHGVFPAGSIRYGIENGTGYFGDTIIEVLDNRLGHDEIGPVNSVVIPCNSCRIEFEAISLHAQKTDHHKQGRVHIQLPLSCYISFHGFSETSLVERTRKDFGSS